MQAEDKALFLAVYCNPKVMRQIADPLTETHASAVFSKLINKNPEQRSHYYWVVETSGVPDASAGLGALIIHSDQSVEVGLMLLPDFSRRGIALKASAALTKYAFEDWRAENILVQHLAANLPVPPIVRAMGMNCIDHQSPVWRWALTKNEWVAIAHQSPYEDEV